MINARGHYDLTPEERAEKLRQALFRHGKPFVIKLNWLVEPLPAAPPPSSNVLHLKHYQRGE